MKKLLSIVLFICLAVAFSANVFAAEQTFGDVNSDGKVNVMDASYLRRYSAKLLTLTEEQIAVADVNGDGNVNALDANSVRQSSAEIIDFFPVEVEAEGICGKEGDGSNIRWTIDIYDTLNIIGEGEMRNYGFDNPAPWAEYTDKFSKVSFDGKVASVGDFAFWELKNIVGEIELPETLKSIGNYAFAGSTISGELHLPEELEVIGLGAFMECKELSGNLEVPGSVKYVNIQAFRNCGFDGELILNEGIKRIGYAAFSDNGFNGELSIPDSVTIINEWAFSNSGLSGVVNIPDGLEGLGAGAFDSEGFTAFNVSENNQSYSSEGAVLFNKDKTELLSCLTSKTGNYIVPETVESIFGYAFKDTSLDEIILLNGVKNISDFAFANAGAKIKILGNLESFGAQENAGEIYFYGNAPVSAINGENTVIYYPSDDSSWNVSGGKWNRYFAYQWEPEDAHLIISEKSEGKVTVELTENEGVSILQFALKYDTNKINITSCNCLLPGATINIAIPGEIYVVWEALAPTEITELLEIEFTSSDENTVFEVNEEEDFIFCDPDYEDMKVGIINCTIG